MVVPSGWWHCVDTTDGALMVGYDFKSSIEQFHRGNTAVYGSTMTHAPTTITAELAEAVEAFSVRVPTHGANGTVRKGPRNAYWDAIRRTVASTGTPIRGLNSVGHRRKSKAKKWSSLFSVTIQTLYKHLLLYTPITIHTQQTTTKKNQKNMSKLHSRTHVQIARLRR
jgi:hypothetical protein